MNVGFSTLMIQRGQSGVAQYVFALLKSLLPFATDHHFTLFVLEDDLPLFESVKSAMEIVTVPETFREPVKNILWHQIRLPFLVRQYKIDVLHVPSYRRLLWPHPCPLVATIHDLAPFLIANKYDWKRMFYGRVVVKHLAKRQDQIIAISHNTARDISRFFHLPLHRLTVIHNGLDHERFFPGSNAEAKKRVEQQAGITGHFFLYVARLEHPAKNHLRLIAAFDQFKSETRSPWKLVLAGSDWHGAEVIHDAIRRSPFAQDIRALGFVADLDLPNWYRAADAFLYPSLYEGFGLPPLEAMACGCPVISSGRGALTEVLGSAAEIVNPEDCSQLSAVLANISKNPALCQKLRASGIARAQFFDWKKTARATFQVYEHTRQAARHHGRSSRLPLSARILQPMK